MNQRGDETPRHRWSLRLGVLCLVSLVVLSAGAVGPVGGVTDVSDCTTIDSSGTYTLTGNVTGPADEPCFVIEAKDVVLDGNGYTIAGNGNGTREGYPILVENVSNVTVSNVTVSNVTVRDVRVANWSRPVRFQDVNNTTVRNVVIRDGFREIADAPGLRIDGGTNHTVVDSRIARMPSDGIVLNQTVRTDVRRSASKTNERDGIAINGGRKVTVSNGNFTDNNRRGIEAWAVDRLTVKHNTVRSGNRTGIHLRASDDARITANSVTGYGLYGIAVIPGFNTVFNNTIRDNRVRNNGVQGFESGGILVRGATGSLVSNNTVEENFRPGIWVDGSPRTVVEGNTLRRNGDGIEVSSSFENSSGSVERNRIVNNSRAGINVTAFGGAWVRGVDVHRNVIERNGDYGLRSGAYEANLNATDNWWGNETGPSSPATADGTLSDPATGAVANGTGGPVSENTSDVGVSNVRFDPWLRTKPALGGLTIITSRLPGSVLNETVNHKIETRGGTPPLTSFEVVNGSLPPGMELGDDGELSGTPTEAGNFTFTVRVTDSESETANATLVKQVVATAPQGQIDIEKAGGAATPGRKTLYVIEITNTGSTIVRDIPVDEYLQPWFTYVTATPTPDNVTTSVVRNGTAENIEAMADRDGEEVDLEEDLTKTTLSWEIDELGPGESRLLTYQARLYEYAPEGMTVTGEACVSKGPCGDKFKECKEAVVSRCNIHDDFTDADTAVSCLQPTTPGCVMGLFGPDPADYCEKAGEKLVCETTYKTCRETSPNALPVDPPCDDDETPVTTAVDPNDKLVAAERHVRSGDRLPYTVRFENIGNGTATDVFVTDRLSESLNRSTLEVVDANGTHRPLNGSTNVTLLKRNKTRTYNVTINGSTVTRNETVTEHHTASLDGRTVTFHLENIDLEPNETGRVLLSVAAKDALDNGTEIRNNATIRFDNVSSLRTNDTVNVIDDVAPTCTVDALPDRSPQSVALSWSGSDPVGEIESVTIMVSNDSDTWRVADVGLTANSTVFQGDLEERYEFMCLAEDTAGNTETQTATAEASTTVPRIYINGTVRTAHDTAAADHTVSVADAADANTTGGIVAQDGNVVCGLTEFTQVGTDADGGYSLITDVNVGKDLAYYQASQGAFLRGNGSTPPAERTFPKDDSPDLYALDRFTPSNDTSRGSTTLPTAHTLNVTVETEAGDPVENATVVFFHTGTNGSRATVAFPNGTNAAGVFEPNAAVGPGLELTGDVAVKVLPPNEPAYVAQAYRQETTVTETETLTVQVATRPPAARYANSDGVVDTDGLRGAIGDWRGGDLGTDPLRQVVDYWRSGEQVETTSSPAAAYTNSDDIVDTDGLRTAIDDWRGGEITTDLLRTVIDAWRSGERIQ